MHIAICDDNVADRKHLERLLNRASDNYKHDTGVFYIDSFGQFEILAKAPMLYNLFFLDLVGTKLNGYDAALALKSAGVTAPIILCSSQINYEHKINSAESDRLLHIKKPFSAALLSSILKKAIALQDKRVSTIELRSERETLYVSSDEIIYGRSSGYRSTEIVLTGERKILILSDMLNILSEISTHDCFIMISKKCFVNQNHIKNSSFTKYHMSDGITLSTLPFKG